ncbi:GNAT family N-acetyltransferase [Dyella psychrodurans]|uniref:GNAT family N-acetyltransferase n=1 Tax=Dyella psychrodurans TaxID=1927960 RepID=A0A370WZ80_9GAMM|nr:GNAT family N-acetyltransferase [Dyella psychrodurans]
MLASERLPGFPPASPAIGISEPMRARSIQLRAARTDDLPYLRGLYRALRSEELSLADWPEAFKQTFLDDQFALQHMHYVNSYADADFWVIERHQQAIGRYYLLREPPCYHIVDITLDPAWRSRGVGSLLLDWTQSLVRQHDAAAIGLHVDERNVGAQRLYARHGFAETSREAPYIAMRWNNVAQLNTA